MREAPAVFPGKDGGRLQIYHKRKGQNRMRNGNTVSQLNNGRSSGSSLSVLLLNHWLIVCIVRRKCENGGWEKSRLWNQRRRVEGAARRSGSLTTGAACSQEQPSTKRLRSAWLRAIRL
jgi:hypothetical protein